MSSGRADPQHIILDLLSDFNQDGRFINFPAENKIIETKNIRHVCGSAHVKVEKKQKKFQSFHPTPLLTYTNCYVDNSVCFCFMLMMRCFA